jgi:hypothetical protein
MKYEGPPLELLLRRLSECPAEFWECGGQSYSVAIAIACDTLRMGDADFLPAPVQKSMQGASRNLCGLLSVTMWLVADEWFAQRSEIQEQLLRLIESRRLSDLAHLVKPEQLALDPDRREELVRLVLDHFDIRPAGETIEQAKDRLTILDSVERTRVLQATLAAEKRAREVREAMARAKAQESASRYSE